jgi:hypothetical protein
MSDEEDHGEDGGPRGMVTGQRATSAKELQEKPFLTLTIKYIVAAIVFPSARFEPT